MDFPRRAQYTNNFILGDWIVQGQLPFRIIFALEKNLSKEISRFLKCTEVLFLQKYKGVK